MIFFKVETPAVTVGCVNFPMPPRDGFTPLRVVRHKVGDVLDFDGFSWTVLGFRGYYIQLERDDGITVELSRQFVNECLKVEGRVAS